MFLLSAAAATTFTVSASNALPSLKTLGWEKRSFSGNTDYSVVSTENGIAIKATTSGAASALYRRLSIDLRKTPYISWQWKIQNTYDNQHEKEKKGDDFPARVYVVYRKGLFFWNTLAINYVWSSQYDKGSHWKSAYTENSQVVVLQSGTKDKGRWMTEKRDVAADFRQYFNIDVDKINGYALMVDGDNTGSKATTWFADIQFTAER